MAVKLVSVVIPVYFEEEVIERSYERISGVMRNSGYDYELLFVDDGSADRTLEILKNISQKDRQVRIISFSRNFGHQIAVTAGIDNAKGDAIVVIDADLQDPPELIPEMLRKWEEGYEVVHAKRKSRKGESLFKLATASLFYRILTRLTDINIPQDVGDYKLIDRKVADQMKQIRERSRFVRGLLCWVGFRQCTIDFVREERAAGTTKYPFGKMLRFAVNGIISFSGKPLKIALDMGFFCVFLGLALIIYFIGLKFFAPQIIVHGWTSTLVIIVFFGGIQLFTIGIIGEYIERIYDEVKNRPLYIIREEIGNDETGK